MFKAREIATTGLFAAITAVLAQISFQVPFSPAPVTMQILAVCLSAAIPGWKCGIASQTVYLLMGAAGLPVFSGFRGGPAVLLGPTGGYLIGFPLAAAVIAGLIGTKRQVGILRIFFSMLCGLSLCYALGTAWLGFSLNLTPWKAVVMGALPYLPLDLAKTALAAFLSGNVRSRLFKAGLLPHATR